MERKLHALLLLVERGVGRMIAELFLICALSLPSPHFTWPRMVSYHEAPAVTSIKMIEAEPEEEHLKDWLKKHNEIDDVFIHDTPQEEKLKEHGWERVPFTWKGKQIWIKRKPHSDQPRQRAVESSA